MLQEGVPSKSEMPTTNSAPLKMIRYAGGEINAYYFNTVNGFISVEQFFFV